MKLIKKLRKGFTLIELVVVIAVIAILSAVTVVSYIAITNKAKATSDEAAVKQMNTCLAAHEITGARDITELFAVLAEEGMDAKNFKPLAKDTYFFWDQEDNRIVYAKYEDGQYVGLYPEAYKGKTKGDHHWFSLSQEIKTVKVEKQASGEYSLSTAEELYTVLAPNSDHSPTKITLTQDVDLMGADVTFTGVTELDGGGKTISGVSQLTSAFTSSQAGENFGEAYNSGLFSTITEDTTISNIKLEGIVVGSYETGNTGVLVGQIKSAHVVIDNVSVKDCTVYARQKGAALIGSIAKLDGNPTVGSVEIHSNVSISNVDVYTMQGEAAKLVGGTGQNSVIVNEASISNVTLHRGPNNEEVKFTSAVGGTVNGNQITSGYLVNGGDDKTDTKTYFRMFNESALLTIWNGSTITYNTVNYAAAGNSGNVTVGSKTVEIKGTLPLIL